MDDKKRRNIVMNEKLQYASMLEIPVSTCNVTYKADKEKTVRQKKIRRDRRRKKRIA